MSDFFPVIDVEVKNENPESLGTKEKFWIEHGGENFLLKYGRDGTGEDWAEKVACELCKLLDLPHADYELALHNGRMCTLSKSFISKDERLILGNELIGTAKKTADGAKSYQQKEHTISRVLVAILFSTDPDAKNFSLPRFSEHWHNFIGYLMLDAWLGNCDRHSENWGVIIGKSRTVRLAPTFDHASCLGRELTDEVRAERLMTKDVRFSVAAYADKARSALYGDPTERRPMSPFDAYASAARHQTSSALTWTKKLRSITPDVFESILERIPDYFITKTAREFAFSILVHNRNKILT
ncbi:hypothetical protein ACNSPG_11585 [Brucella pituitosa]|uniref:hypothetical protein n=1 Tax=Brucella pituitosa TaxID=571256 RepID=UPI003C7240D7